MDVAAAQSHPFLLDKSFHTKLSGQPSEQLLLGNFLLDELSYCVKVNIMASWSRRDRGRHYRNYPLLPKIMITHFFQFSRGLPQDVQAEDEERPGGVHKLHGAGREDRIPGVCVSRRIISSLANYTDRWDLSHPRGWVHFSDNRLSLGSTFFWSFTKRDWTKMSLERAKCCREMLQVAKRERTICQTIKRLSQNLSLISWSTSIKWVLDMIIIQQTLLEENRKGESFCSKLKLISYHLSSFGIGVWNIIFIWSYPDQPWKICAQ